MELKTKQAPNLVKAPRNLLLMGLLAPIKVYTHIYIFKKIRESKKKKKVLFKKIYFYADAPCVCIVYK